MFIAPIAQTSPTFLSGAAKGAAKTKAQDAPSAPSESFRSGSPASTEVAPSRLREAFDSVLNAGGPAEATLVDDNTSAWNARWKMLEGAHENINAQYFCWDHDIFGKAMLGLIYKKASQEGVHTRVMVDATGDTLGTRGFKSHIGGRDYLQELVSLPNAEAKVYHPHYKKLIDAVTHVGKSYIAASNHDKILEVDGQHAVTGGRNISYEYFASPEDNKAAWRDTDAVIEGAAPALALRNAFEVEFGAPWINDKVTPDLFGNWVKRDLELLGAYAVMDSWLKDTPLTPQEKEEIRKSPELREKMAQELYEDVLARLPGDGATREPGKREKKAIKKLALEMVGHPDKRGSYHVTPGGKHEAEVKILDRTSIVGTAQDGIGKTLAKMVQAAEKRIVIENPYIVMTDSLLATLKEAGERGVEIWLGTNSPSSTDSAVTQAFFLQDWPRILATVPNLRIFVATGERKLHAKVATADDQVSLVSSYNLDLLSTEINSEVGALIWSKDFANDTFNSIMADHDNPRNGVREYTILRDESGKPIRRDGKPVLNEQGELINDPDISFGPKDHLTTEVLDKYETKMRRWSWLREHLPQLHSLNTFRTRFGGDQ
jgi:phosphatidylserine/phosphatidylglycerophosphate/cardiolipin synthase-like enzyme